jgi:nucleotide-binding universal stress UspA family protein
MEGNHDIVHYVQEHEEYSSLTRVVVICLDEETCESVFQWSVHNFINPQLDMVILVNVRPSEHFTTPYGNQTDYLIKISERHKDESHVLLKKYGAQLTAKKVITIFLFHSTLDKTEPHLTNIVQIACKAISLHGDAQHEIVSKAQEVKADVVIVGSHGSGFLKRCVTQTYLLSNENGVLHFVLLFA